MRSLSVRPWSRGVRGARLRTLTSVVVAAELTFGIGLGHARPSALSGEVGVGSARAQGPAADLPIRFDSEIIRIAVAEDSMEVDGLYFLVRSPSPRPVMHLFYPYPEDSLLGGARMVSLEAHSTRPDSVASPAERSAPSTWPAADPAAGSSAWLWEPIRYEDRARGSRWAIPLGPADTLVVRAVYRQALRASYARYIVTSTSAWGRPLRSARFEIRLPRGAEPVRFSFPFERIEGDEPLWVYETRSFLPDKDIIVEWKPSR